jgi:hypothetical protein
VPHRPRAAAPVPPPSLTPRARLAHVVPDLNDRVGVVVGAPAGILRTSRDREVQPERAIQAIRRDTADRQDLARGRVVRASERRGWIVMQRRPGVPRGPLLRRRTQKVSGSQSMNSLPHATSLGGLLPGVTWTIAVGNQSSKL